MTSLGSGTPSTSRPAKFTGLGTVVLAAVFLVALVFAANNNSVLGWFIAVIALGWLLLSTIVYIGVHKAARFGAEQVRLAQAQMAQATSAAAPNGAGTRLVNDGSDGVRDLKLDHSFKIIQVQAGVITDNLGKDAAVVARALDTIQITASNGRGMIKKDGAPASGQQADGQTKAPGKDGGRNDDGETITGVVVD
ncbi:hypothetical protein [Arthrobacter sp. 35W]|uniref:hypothetical protein n=1 Tax=Arthrobacter sp. 35W TaxID=1132441 RepID=UPI00041BE8BE|nr:hypothetical protein [Arthrobacter sp. 35W]